MQQVAHAGLEHVRVEWFDDIVVGPCLKTHYDVLLVVHGRKQYHGDMAGSECRFDMAAQGVAIYLGHYKVGEHKVGLLLLCGLDCRSAVYGSEHVEFIAQKLTQVAEHLGIVLNDKDGRPLFFGRSLLWDCEFLFLHNAGLRPLVFHGEEQGERRTAALRTLQGDGTVVHGNQLARYHQTYSIARFVHVPGVCSTHSAVEDAGAGRLGNSYSGVFDDKAPVAPKALGRHRDGTGFRVFNGIRDEVLDDAVHLAPVYQNLLQVPVYIESQVYSLAVGKRTEGVDCLSKVVCRIYGLQLQPAFFLTVLAQVQQTVYHAHEPVAVAHCGGHGLANGLWKRFVLVHHHQGAFDKGNRRLELVGKVDESIQPFLHHLAVHLTAAVPFKKHQDYQPKYGINQECPPGKKCRRTDHDGQRLLSKC